MSACYSATRKVPRGSPSSVLCLTCAVLLPACLGAVLPATDTLLPILTVEEMLLYTAELKQPRSIPLADKQAAVEELLDKLALQPCRSADTQGALLQGVVLCELATSHMCLGMGANRPWHNSVFKSSGPSGPQFPAAR